MVQTLAGKGRKIYKSPKPGKIIVRILVCLLAAVIVAAVVLFFYLQKFIVIRGGDVQLKIPFMEEIRAQEELPEADIIIEE